MYVLFQNTEIYVCALLAKREPLRNGDFREKDVSHAFFLFLFGIHKLARQLHQEQTQMEVQ